MPASKIVSEQEIVKWIEEGRTYRWMADEYLRKYHLEVGLTMFSNFRRRRGLDGRNVRDDTLLPWEVRLEHRYSWDPHMLRVEARRRAGKPISEQETELIDGFIRNLKREEAVIHYDPDTERGFFHVAPRDGIDTDLIRVPERATTRRPAVD